MWLYELTYRLRPVWSLYWTFRVTGNPAAVPRTGPALVAANHSSYLDPWMLGVPFPRPVRQIINRRWFERSPTWRAFFEANGTIPLSADDPDGTLEEVARAFDRGEVVGIFPEGRISTDGRLQRFRSGVAFIPARTGVPVVPVGIRGAFESMPKGRAWPKRGPIEIRIGDRMTYDDDPADLRALMRFRDRVRREIAHLSGQADA